MRLALLLALLWPGITLAQIRDNVQTSTLKNGMKILVQEDHTIPTVALYFFYRVGSRNERPGITGISHFFEHMMFNGSQHFAPGEFVAQLLVPRTFLQFRERRQDGMKAREAAGNVVCNFQPKHPWSRLEAQLSLSW